jgi:malate synthase
VLQCQAGPGDRHDEILTPAALDFVGHLAAAFGERRQALLKERRRQALRLATGSPLDFPMVTSAIRADPDWRVAPPAPGLADRRVEITGPPERRMAVNALNSGARVWNVHAAGDIGATWYRQGESLRSPIYLVGDEFGQPPVRNPHHLGETGADTPRAQPSAHSPRRAWRRVG